MNALPEDPATFRPAPVPNRPWWWRLESASGETVAVDPEYAEQRFVVQADAESWIGETWAELTELGVDAVTLFEDERQVYGPMSLHG